MVRTDEGGRYLVEFRPEVKIVGSLKKRVRSVEWVTLRKPDQIEFDHHEGVLSLLHDRFLISDEGETTRLRYESTMGLSGWVFGWALAFFVVRPLLQRFMFSHVKELKENIERMRVGKGAA